MRDIKKFRWAYCIVLIAVGILLSLLENVLQGTIVVLLVLQFPVFIAGFTAGALPGLLTGAAVPLLASLATGYPSWPMLPMMMAELMLYGFLSGVMTERTKMSRVLILITAMIAGRIGYLLVSLALPVFGSYVPEGINAANAAIDGIPGILLQLVFIPPIADAIEKFTFKGKLRYD
jgi:hypothetical protein